ncbi:WD repeat-containing protein 61, partial [Galemys pyrenaicus]
PFILLKEMTNQHSILFKQEQAQMMPFGPLLERWSGNGDERLDLQWAPGGRQLDVVPVDISHILPLLQPVLLMLTSQTDKVYKAGPMIKIQAFSCFLEHDHRNSCGENECFLVCKVRKGILPNGNYLARGAIDGLINIFNIATGKFLHMVEGHAIAIHSLTFPLDSQLLVTASNDGYIKIYDVQCAKLAGTLSSHASCVLRI